MTIIQECTADGYCVIREDNYSNSVGKILRLLALAQADFPTLKPDHINVVRYGGTRYKGTIGLEFIAPATIPTHYRRIPELELTI